MKVENWLELHIWELAKLEAICISKLKILGSPISIISRFNTANSLTNYNPMFL